MKELEKRREERLLQEKKREVKNVCLFALKISSSHLHQTLLYGWLDCFHFIDNLSKCRPNEKKNYFHIAHLSQHVPLPIFSSPQSQTFEFFLFYDSLKSLNIAGNYSNLAFLCNIIFFHHVKVA